MEVVASLSQGRTAAAQCGLFAFKSVSVVFEPPCIFSGDAGVFKLRHGLWIMRETPCIITGDNVSHRNVRLSSADEMRS